MDQPGARESSSANSERLPSGAASGFSALELCYRKKAAFNTELDQTRRIAASVETSCIFGLHEKAIMLAALNAQITRLRYNLRRLSERITCLEEHGFEIRNRKVLTTRDNGGANVFRSEIEREDASSGIPENQKIDWEVIPFDFVDTHRQ